MINDYLIIATAGHVDHGKTSLIKTITGKDIERKIEKQKGMTIDLGFSYFTLPTGKKIGIIDVPGHEKFLKNMLAGVFNIDLVILVVAADDGVMPQTIEHFNIIQLLEIKNLIIVITKSDLVDNEILELVKEDINELIKNTYFSNSPIIVTSSITNQGINELIAVISNYSKIINKKDSNFVRLPIDRIFIKQGFGTIVTGTLISGQINKGDILEVLPLKKLIKVRTIEVHGNKTNYCNLGFRVALNITGIEHNELKRGYEIVTKEKFISTKTIECKFKVLSKDILLKNNLRVCVYINTNEVYGRLIILDKISEDTYYIRIKLEEPIVADFEDKIILRLYSPRITIGGGKVLCYLPQILKLNRVQNINLLKFYENRDFEKLFLELFKLNKYKPLEKKQLIARIPSEILEKILIELKDKVLFLDLNTIILKESFLNERNKLVEFLEDFYKIYPYKIGIYYSELNKKFNSNILNYILNELKEEGKIKIWNNTIVLSTYKLNFTPEQITNLNDIMNLFDKNVFLEEKDIISNVKTEYIKDLLNYLLFTNEIILISNYLKIFIKKTKFIEFKNKIKDYINKQNSISISECKTILNISRKYCVPFLEYLDTIGFTKRKGDIRILN